MSKLLKEKKKCGTKVVSLGDKCLEHNLNDISELQTNDIKRFETNTRIFFKCDQVEPGPFENFTRVVYSTSANVRIVDLDGSNQGNFGAGTAVFPGIQAMAADRVNGFLWTYQTIPGTLHRIWKHIEGGLAAIVFNIPRTLFSSVAAADLFYDAVNSKVVLGFGEAGGFTPGITRLNGDGSSIEYPWINLNAVSCFDIWVGNQGPLALNGVALFEGELYAWSGHPTIAKFMKFPYIASGTPPTCTTIATATINGLTMTSIKYSNRNDKFYYATTVGAAGCRDVYQIDTDMTNPTLVRNVGTDGRSVLSMDIDDNNQQLVVGADDGVYTLDISSIPAPAMSQVHNEGAQVRNVIAWP